MMTIFSPPSPLDKKTPLYYNYSIEVFPMRYIKKIVILTIINCTIIFFIVTTCSNNKESQIQDTKHEIRTNIAMPTTIEWSSYDESYINLSYSNSLDITLVETKFLNTIKDLLGISEYDFTSPYSAIYWDSHNNTYYAVTNYDVFNYPIPVSNTNFAYALNNPNQIEPVFYPEYQEIFPDTKATLLYIGDLSSPLERVYLDPTNQVYYIKRLEAFDTSFYISDFNDIVKTNDSTPIYPAISSNIIEHTSGVLELLGVSVIYTNENKQILYMTKYNLNPSFMISYPPVFHYSREVRD